MSLFGYPEVTVAEQSDHVAVASYYPVQKIFSTYITYQGYTSATQILIFERAERYLVATIYDERIHTVTLGGYGNGSAF